MFRATHHTYDAWGKVVSITGSLASTVGQINPFRYRGYYYDTETEWYYLQSRYYDPEIGRFLNADGIVGANGGVVGYNMFAYCNNNPVIYKDDTGEFLKLAVLVVVVIIVCAVPLSSCSKKPESNDVAGPRSDLANAPDLDNDTANHDSYNCYGNGIGKEIVADPTGYETGDSTRETFEAVKDDLGQDNVRELDSIDAPIRPDEFKVAMKCGKYDYHFIRLDENGWYNKSGRKPGLYISQEMVSANIWFPIWKENGMVLYFPELPYEYETIYFAVKVDWDE